MLGAATRRLPRLESSGDLAALNTRHLLRKPVCGLKAPLGLSCPAGTAVLSGTLLYAQKSTSPAAMLFAKGAKTSNTRKRSAREQSFLFYFLLFFTFFPCFSSFRFSWFLLCFPEIYIKYHPSAFVLSGRVLFCFPLFQVPPSTENSG